jgi:hypothetical protein
LIITLCAYLDDSYEVGSAPPASKPRPKQQQQQASTEPVTNGLFERKLTKEEKKRLAAEKRAARKVAKAEKQK